MAYTRIFRFDDVCINADINLINDIASFILERVPDCQILFGVSPLVHNGCGQRVFPEILNAYSDHKKFYSVNQAGIPKDLHPQASLAGHGLFHIDHRLIGYEAQEISILISCSLVGTKTFIPPFNKYNQFTIDICNQNGIKLIKFEDGWKSCEYNKYQKSHDLWYLHAREWTMDKFIKWFNESI